VLTDLNDWDADAERANGRTLSYSYSYSPGATPIFDIDYTVCDSTDCADWRGYQLTNGTSDDLPTAEVIYASPSLSIGVLYYLLSERWPRNFRQPDR
jgi:hypothetical protein